MFDPLLELAGLHRALPEVLKRPRPVRLRRRRALVPADRVDLRQPAESRVRAREDLVRLEETAGSVEVICGAPSVSPTEIAELYLAGTLGTGDNLCDH